jgi:hypothetical protein
MKDVVCKGPAKKEKKILNQLLKDKSNQFREFIAFTLLIYQKYLKYQPISQLPS